MGALKDKGSNPVPISGLAPANFQFPITEYRYLPEVVRHEGVICGAGPSRALHITLAVPGARWSVDSVHDELVTCQRFHILNVIDDVREKCLAADCDINSVTPLLIDSRRCSPSEYA